MKDVASTNYYKFKLIYSLFIRVVQLVGLFFSPASMVYLFYVDKLIIIKVPGNLDNIYLL